MWLRETSAETKLAGSKILDFPASKTVRKKYLLFKPPSLCILLQELKQTNTHDKNLAMIIILILAPGSSSGS